MGEEDFSYQTYGKYQALNVKVADMTTLLKLKIVAVGDTILIHDDIEHERHARDLVALLKSLDIKSIEKLLDITPLSAEYPELLRILFPG